MLIRGKPFEHNRYALRNGTSILDYFTGGHIEIDFEESRKNEENLYDWSQRNIKFIEVYIRAMNNDYWSYMLECFDYLDESKSEGERTYNRIHIPINNGKIETYHQYLNRKAEESQLKTSIGSWKRQLTFTNTTKKYRF
jgi:hypothetical protein